MTDEKVLLEALSSGDFKVSVRDKNRTDRLETETAIETKKQFGEDTSSTSLDRNDDAKALLSMIKGMSSSQRQTVIDTLKQNGLGDPLTKEKLIQNAFTVEKTIRDNASN
ncbi:unnamed protein product [Adineta ricciae]|uniref:Uncharacterized protein n=1 Tax=Adineta ricciae TaxID=249248 RepID=A0A816FV50_ADIRI|nr:unnamed protein product [Adineta ricciae]